MDIPSLSMSMAQTNLLTDVGTAMLAKSMEQADIITASMTEMLDASAMELSVNPDIGGNIDISVKKTSDSPLGLFLVIFCYTRRITSGLMTIFPFFSRLPTARLNSFLLIPVSRRITSGLALSVNGRTPS